MRAESTPRVGTGLFWLLAAAVGIALLVGTRLWFDNEYFFFAAYVVLQYIVLATAWNILGGYTGYINFGTGAFFAIGAYSTVVLHNLHAKPAFMQDWFGMALPAVPLPLMILVGGIVAGLIGLGTGYLTLRLRGVFFAIATLALAVVVQTLIVNWDYVGGSRGTYVIRPARGPFGATYIQYLYALMIALSVIAVAIARTIERSRLGLGFAAIRDDEQAAEAGGVPTLRLKLVATTLSGGLMGMAGAPLPYYVTYIEPSSAFNLSYAVNSVAMPVIGGMTSWIGPIIGAVLLGSIQQLATVTISSAVNLLIVGLLLIIFVIFAPNGIVDLLRGPASGPFAPPLPRLSFLIRLAALGAGMLLIYLVGNFGLTLLAIFIILTGLLAFASQRLRDMGQSGWWAMLILIPVVNLILLFILLFAPSRSPHRGDTLEAPSLPAREGAAHG
jgi:branched-chain amino acid transport system permease protein